MSYSPSTNPPHAVTDGGLAGTLAKLWLYTGTDADLSGQFFVDGHSRGMKVNHLVIAIDTDGGTTKLYRCVAVAPVDPKNPHAPRSATLSAGIQIGH